LPELVVVKIMHSERTQQRGAIERFVHEAQVAVRLSSPHIAEIYEMGALGDRHYIAMEYVPGPTLVDVLKDLWTKGKPPHFAAVMAIVAGLLEALHALHTARDPDSGAALEAIHRDIAPKNVIVGEDGRVRLIDLGLGKSRLGTWKTKAGALLGTLGYMAPEQAAGLPVDLRGDLYAVSVICFELLTLEAYLSRGSNAEMLASAQAPVFRRPSTIRPDLPPHIDAALERALAIKPEERFPSAKALMEALRIAPGNASGELAVRAMIGEMIETNEKTQQAPNPAPAASLLRDDEALKTDVQARDEDEGPIDETTVFARRSGKARPTDLLQYVKINSADPEQVETSVSPSRPDADTTSADPSLTPTPILSPKSAHRPTVAKTIVDHRTSPLIAVKRKRATSMLLALVVLILALVAALLVALRDPNVREVDITPDLASQPAPAPLPRAMATKAKQEKEVAPDDPQPGSWGHRAPSGQDVASEHGHEGKRDAARDTTGGRGTSRAMRTAATPAPISTAPEPPPRSGVEATEASVRSAIIRVTGLGNRLRTALPERAGEIDRIMADASMWTGSNDLEQAAATLTKLESRLRRMEAHERTTSN
jgi:serine/threonine protein kinase